MAVPGFMVECSVYGHDSTIGINHEEAARIIIQRVTDTVAWVRINCESCNADCRSDRCCLRNLIRIYVDIGNGVVDE